MEKYSFEFKKQVVEAYLNNEGGYIKIAKRFGISNGPGDHGSVRDWVKKYRALGDEGLRPTTKKSSYSFEDKLSMVESYLSEEHTIQELAKIYRVRDPQLISSWVRAYRISGPSGLVSKKDRGALLMNQEQRKVDTSEKHVRELEEKVLKLQIEVDYLKELRRLRRKEKSTLKKKQGSSSASAKNTD